MKNFEEILKMLECWADETDGGFVVSLARPVTLNGEEVYDGCSEAYGEDNTLRERCLEELRSRMAAHNS